MMNDLLQYLIEVNLILVILYAAYRIFFRRDRNFQIRRIFLLGILIIPVLLPLIPEAIRIAAGKIAPVAIPLEEITIYARPPAAGPEGSLSQGQILPFIYLAVSTAWLSRMLLQLAGVFMAIRRSERHMVDGKWVLSHPGLNASSFFGYIFLDPDSTGESSRAHILQHEGIHCKGWHSVDRLMAEVVTGVLWINPLIWIVRKDVIQNLEYLADSAVVGQGTDIRGYQLSILNQYIGSASITNSFSSHLKTRIHMLNTEYKRGSAWKIVLALPLIFLSVLVLSCSEKSAAEEVYAVDEMPEPDDARALTLADEELFYVVEEMPTFRGEEPEAFRYYVAKNLRYPEEAKNNGVTGRVFVKFVVTKTGKVVIPEEQYIAKMEEKSAEEVVVVAYRPLEVSESEPDEKYIQLLKDEVIRVISESPDWEPGMQRGEKVNVMFTFPVNFALQ